MSEALAESTTAEAAHAAAIATEAMAKARKADLDVAIAAGLESYFEGRKSGRFIDINRIPFICDDIRSIHDLLDKKLPAVDDIKRDLNWMKYLGGGFVIAAGLLALKSLGI